MKQTFMQSSTYIWWMDKTDTNIWLTAFTTTNTVFCYHLYDSSRGVQLPENWMIVL